MKFNGLCLVIFLLLLGAGDSQRGPNGRQARQRGQQWGGTSQGGLGGQQVDPAANKGNNWAPSTQAQFPSTTSYPGGNNWGPSTTTGMFIGSGGGGGGGGGPVTSGVRSGNGAGGTGAAAGGGGTGSGGGGGGGGAWGPPQTTTVAPTTGAGGWGAPSSPSSAPVQGGGGRGGGGRGGGGGGGTGGRGGAGRRRGPNGRGGARGGGGGGGFEYGIGGGRGGGGAVAAPAAPAAPVAAGGIFGGSLMGWHHGAIEPGNFEPEPTYIIAGPGATPYNAGAMSGGGAFAAAAGFGAGSSLMFQWPSNGNWYYSNGPIKIGYRVCPQLAQRVAECGKGPMTPCAPLCKVYPTAKCLVNPCGGCFAEWYLGNRRLLDCD